ncbi:MAG: AI-2E family transporter [Microcystaceae cyanobacterium]
MDNQAKVTNLIIRLVFLAALAFGCFAILRPFLGIVIWGAILATSIYPVMEWLKNVLGGRTKLAVILLCLVGIGIIIGPIAYLATLLVDNIQVLVKQLSADTINVPPPPPTLETWPVIGQPLNEVWQSAAVNLKGVLGRFRTQIEQLIPRLLLIAANTGLILLKFIISIIIAAALLLNTAAINRGLTKFFTKLVPTQGEAFLELSASTIRGVTRGVIGVALIQALLIGIGMAIAKIPAAGLLTLICLVLAIIQLGPGLVVIPTIIWAFFSIGTGWAILYTAWMIPCLVIDNVLKPMLMGQGLPVPILVVFIGVIGGTLSNGILGLFIGPVILSLGYEILVAWVNESVSDEKAIAESNYEI